MIVRKFSRDWIAGYAPISWQDPVWMEMLDLAGKVVRIEWDAIKWLCYVKDLPATADHGNPERLVHKRFSVRPRTAGLWLHMTLQDGDELEGLAANDRTLIDGSGLMLTPPDMRSNTQRIFIPRSAIKLLEVVSLIGSGKRRAGTPSDQPELFPEVADRD